MKGNKKSVGIDASDKTVNRHSKGEKFISGIFACEVISEDGYRVRLLGADSFLDAGEWVDGHYEAKVHTKHLKVPKFIFDNDHRYAVTEIGSSAFSGWKALTAVTVPDGVEAIDSCAFIACPSLSRINLPKSLSNISPRAFDNCRAFSYISVDKGNPVYSSKDGVLYCDESMTLAIWPVANRFDAIPWNVTKIGDFAFYMNKALQSISISKRITAIGKQAFEGCENLKEIKLDSKESSFYYENGILFDKNKSAVILSLPKALSSSVIIPDTVKEICDGAFANCELLNGIDLPNSLTRIGEKAFCGCKSLKSVEIPDSVNCILDMTFEDCTSLASVKLPSKMTKIGRAAFIRCKALCSINLPDSITLIDEFAFYGCESLTSLKIPEGVDKVSGWSFACCYELTNISMPNSVACIEEGAFWGCEKLQMGKFPTALKAIGDRAFYGCISLERLEIPESVKSIGNLAFYDCISLHDSKIPNTVQIIGEDAFGLRFDTNTNNYQI